MPVTQYRSPGVYGIEKTPARAAEGLSPAKAGFVGWTDKGPSNYPIQVRSVEEFTSAFGPISARGVVPFEVRGFFGSGGQAAWVSRTVPADATSASVAIDSIPGPTKWTFAANGAGIWGNNVKVLIRGNRNFLDSTTNQWDKFDVLILQPSDFDPTVDEADEVYEQVQFTNPAASDYVSTVLNDPRKPSLLVKLTVGAGGTPSTLLSVTVPNEAIGTGGGSPLASRFVASLANVPVLANSLVIKAVSKTVVNNTLSPTLGSINGINTAFNFQTPLGDLPLIEESLHAYYQKLSVLNELVVATTGSVDGSNKTFVVVANSIKNAVHREIVAFKLKYAAVAGASPQTLTTVGGVAATYDLSIAPLTTTPVHPGTVSIAVNLNGGGLATIVDDGHGNLVGNGGSLPLGGTIDYTTGIMTGITAALTASSTVVATYNKSNIITKLAQVNVPLTGVTGTPLVGDIITVGAATGNVVSVNSVGGVVASVDVNVTSGTIATSTAATFATSGASATTGSPITPNNIGQFVGLAGSLTTQVHITYSTLAVNHFSVGDTVTQGGASGTVTAVTTTSSTTGSIDLNVSAGTFNPTGALADTTSTATAVATSVLTDNYINLVNDITNPVGAGKLSFETAIAPIAGTNFYMDYKALGLVSSTLAGVLAGDVTAGSTVNFDTGQIIVNFSNPPLSGSTVEFSYLQGQLVQDNGIGGLIGDINAAGNNIIDYNLGTIDVTFATPPPSATPITASYVKLSQAVQFQLSGGSDGSAVSRNDISNPSLAVNKTGIYALDLVEEPLNLVVPDFEGSEFVQADIVDFCDARQDRFAILGFANGTTTSEALQYVLVDQAFDTRNAAIYFPNINFINDATGVPVLVPCTGFVAGIYAKTAQNKNVGKSPGGLVDGALDANGIIGPEIKLDLAARDDLYSARINPLMTSAATGFVVWGVRTLSRDLRWRYVNARLLNNFLMYQIRLNLQWTVFENNGPALWVKITTALEGFLSSLFRQGYFAGQTKDQAYFIKCDARNNNQATVDAGRVNIDVGFSPNKPAEFIVFTLQQPASTVTV